MELVHLYPKTRALSSPLAAELDPKTMVTRSEVIYRCAPSLPSHLLHTALSAVLLVLRIALPDLLLVLLIALPDLLLVLLQQLRLPLTLLLEVLSGCFFHGCSLCF